MRVTIPIIATASKQALAGLASDLAFCHPDIEKIVTVDDKVIELDVARDSEDLRKQVSAVAELSIRSYRFVRDEPALWQHDALRRYAGRDALAEVVARHTITLGPGQYALVGPVARMRMDLDERLRAIATAAGAEPWHLPSIEQTRDLIPATGYLASHAQYVTFGYRLPCHFEQLQRFSLAAKEMKLERPDALDLEPTGFILEPFVCHNVYRALKGARVEVGRTITALGTCYRHEGIRFEPLLRQWEFSMREVVLVGTPAFVAEQRARVIELTKQMAQELDLDARLEIATDPFFVSEAASKRTYQAMSSTKLELKLALDATTSTAAGSFNLHGQQFTEPMQITDGRGEVLETACIGWGLERWMAAVISRHGADARNWPI
jgi:seryl-tRNA synthetase